MNTATKMLAPSRDNVIFIHGPEPKKAANKLWELGYTVLYPTYPSDHKSTVELLIRCDGVSLLPGWQRSQESIDMVAEAKAAGLLILEQKLWIERAEKYNKWKEKPDGKRIFGKNSL